MDRLSTLLAIEEIRSLKARYFRHMDSREWDALQATMTDDVRFEHPAVGRHSSSGAVVEALKVRLAGFSFTSHHGSMPEISVESDKVASGVWSLHSFVVLLPNSSAAGPSTIHGYGRYTDTYRRESGEWKISSIHLEHLHRDTQGAT